MNNFEYKNGYGFQSTENSVITFEIQGITEREEIREKEYRTLYQRYAFDNMTMRIGDLTVPFWGEQHNLYPQQVYSVTSENKLLPEVIHKKVKFLFGKGPRLYREVVTGEGEKQRRVRVPVENAEVQEWLESWESAGFDNHWDYLKNLITDFYYVNTCVSKYNFNRVRRLFEKKPSLALPIIALQYIGADEARLATTLSTNFKKRIKNADCQFVVLGDWLNPNKYDFEIYNRFSSAEPLKYPNAIAFNVDKTFSKHIYALNEWFNGLFEWIKSSNLSPRYLNSYLKNALNAHIHIIIPGSWYRQQTEILQRICSENRDAEAEGTFLQTEYRGVKLIDSAGKAISFYSTMVEELVANELKAISKMMTGEGKNQGKFWASTRWAEKDEWEFKEFPGKFKEYFESVILLDKRADQVILAGLGMSSSITNVENDGVISKSGADVYYNYLLYVASLTYDEYFVLKDLNRALHINFPQLQKEGVKFGFWIDIPAKLQDTTPSERPQQTATADNKSNIQKTQEQEN
ncbi:MAG: hypothetical protein LBN95_06480 [Prevotellaceae bacterium]|jgi:hypothetical protein|nr:hypothetical protein [Prevotellaceae bacterium]